MSHVSSVTNSSYPYRGTLSRLDTNGDGLLSGQERQAGERPGILQENADNSAADSTSGAMSDLMAKLMQLPSADVASRAKLPEHHTDLFSPMDAYNSTYGQYDVGSIAA
ncbi:hypothetical protein RHSP_35219 [Rhizobium freirei PRF 81]|uniref:EF-hand domain-containing protein n=1 Tax=Rhizobium freirei PRF 81 TaxID=363754 RepID=N6U7M7_9HYPH|nr:hypothetical protein [Rhizobium freirei]ENN86283.1 hypothetical protein RHSP_35219 [Rhizobium freirei PRF 81]